MLVGWSWGGDLVRYHAGFHPDDVVGLVYVDPAAYSPAAELRCLDAIGAGEEALEAMEAFADRRRESGEPDGRGEAESAYTDELFDTRTEPDYGPVPAVPAAVIFAGRHEYPPADSLREAGFPEAGLPLFGLAYHEARLRERIARVGEWALTSPGGLLLVASARGHAVHREDPDLVVEVIRRILSEAVAGEAG